MRSISMVSDADGEKLRTFEMARQNKIKNLLLGGIIAEVFFDDGMGISGKTISGLSVVKGKEVFHVSIEDTFYDVIESSLNITGKLGDPVENMIVMPTPCDTCKKPDCKDRTTPGNWVVDCKEATEYLQNTYRLHDETWTRDFIFGEPRDYYENYLDNEFERGHK